MQKTWCSLAFLAAPLAAAPLHVAQSAVQGDAPARDSSRGSLVRVPESEREPASDAAFDRAEWKRKLSESDLDARERNLDALVDLARGDRDAAREARRAVEEWARDAKGGELAWTARMALRQLDRPVVAPPRSLSRPDGRGGLGGLGGLDALQRRMDEMQRQFGGMDSLFEDLQREMRDMLGRRGGAHAWPSPQALPPGASSEQHGFRMEVGPDGVEVEVLEDVDGKQEKKTYKADSLEELLEAHPELRDRIDAGGTAFDAPFGGSFGSRGPLFGRGGAGDGSDPFQGDARPLRPLDPSSRPSPANDERLGVYCAPLDAEAMKELGGEHDSGLRVEGIVQGSLAERLGLKRGDVIVELDGTALASRDDVARVLRERDKNAELRAEVLDSEGNRRTLRYTPKARKAPAENGRPREQQDDESARGKRF